MRDANQRFSKEVEATGQKLLSFRQRQDALNQIQVKLQVSLEQTTKKLQEARKAFKENADEINKTNLEEAYSKYNLLKEQLSETKREFSSAAKEARKLQSEAGKADNRAGGLIKNLAGAGLTKMLGDSLSSAAQVGISSAFGADMGNKLQSMLSGAINGASIGLAAGGGPLGAAIGGGAGMLAGAVSAGAQQLQREDDAFKSYVQESVQESLGKQAADLQAGSSIAADRETALISFTTMFDNDENRAKAYFDEIKMMANNTPFLFDDLRNMSKVLKSYGYTDDKESEYGLIDTMTAIGDTGAALGMTNGDMNEVATALGRMNFSNKTTLEYLNPLLERGVNVMDYLSEGFGIAKDDIYDAVSEGLIPGQAAALCIKEYMQDAFGGSMEKMSKTFPGLLSTLSGWELEMQNAMGEGYNETRKEGIQKQIDYLSGESGARMQDANRMIGAWKADLENQREEIMRRHESEALERIDREKLDVVEGGRLLALAQIEAQAEYNASEGAQLELESQKLLISSVRDSLVQNRDYWDAGYELGQEFSKGMMAATREGVPDALSYTSIYGINTKPSLNESRSQSNVSDSSYTSIYSGASRFTKAAIGIDRVPYDNFPALLHQGERVLTAGEARGSKTPPQISIQVNGLTVREEADVYKIARKLADELQRQQLVAIIAN